MPKRIEISQKTILFILFLVLSVWFISQISQIIVMVFIAFILASALNPFVDKLESLKIPRALAILMVYIVLWSAIGAIMASVIPGLVDQTTRLIRILPLAASRMDLFTAHQQEISQQLLTRVGTLPESLLRIIVGLFGNLLDVLTTIVMSFYFLLYHPRLNKIIGMVTNNGSRDKVIKVTAEVERRLGGWVRGELVLMTSVGLLTYLGLTILGVDIALPLAVLAGILEIVPNIGPIISSIPAVIIALTIHPVVAVATAALYFVVQFLENHLLVPKIMQHAVGINPLVSIVALMVGFKLSGPIGAVLALPIVIIIQTVGIEVFSLRQLETLSE